MVTEFYLTTTKNLENFFQAIKNAKAPDKLTTRFLVQLDLKSNSDRLFITMMKVLGFVDSNGIPVERYFEFLDETRSKQVLAEAIREAYSDLFSININAQNMSKSELKNKFKTLLQGSKSENVYSLMANTFTALCEQANFSETFENSLKEDKLVLKKTVDNYESSEDSKYNIPEFVTKNISTDLHYNIQIHLPETTEIAVYDAIFKSLKEHLL